MVLLNITIVLAVIAIIFLIIGKLTKKKIIKNISIAIFIFIVVFWLGFYAWALVDMNEEYNRHFPSEKTVTNAFIEETNLTNTTAQDIQTSEFSHGRIYSIEDNIIYIYDKDNQKYFSKNRLEFSRFSTYNAACSILIYIILKGLFGTINEHCVT